MPTYKDILLKTSFYKEQIIKEMIRKGIMPDNRVIEDRVSRIDKFVALFEHTNVKTSSKFDTNKFKESIETIQQDLLFLYRLLYELTVKEYEYTKAYVDAHLKELESLSEEYKIRSKIEIDTTSLGKTLLFKNDSFSIFNKDNYAFIDLGIVSPKEESVLSFLFDAGNVEAQNAVLGLQDNEDIYYVSPYNYVQDIFKVPGERVSNSYAYEFEDDQIVNTSFEVMSEGLQPDESNKYLIFGGLDHIHTRTEMGRNLTGKDNNNIYHFPQGGKIQFHIYKGTYARFNFTSQPDEKNFKGNIIDDISDYYTITMQSEDEIAFNLVTDGKVFAELEEGLVRESRLYFPKQSYARTFLIEEIKPGKEKEYQAFVRVDNRNESPLDINSIAIKELSELGGNNYDSL